MKGATWEIPDEVSAVSAWDNPLSHRFDENDSVVYFNDVKVP